MRRTQLVVVTVVAALALVAPTTVATATDHQTGHEVDYEIDWARVEATVAAVDRAGVETLSGELEGAAWIAQVPDGWNGELLVWAHGYRGEGPSLHVDPPAAFDWLVDQGYAWAASSYRRNSYDPGIGVLDTKLLTNHVQSLIGRADQTYLAGVSMGGHVTAAAIEQFPRLYDGALPACGVLGDVELFDYFLDYNLGAAAFAGLDPDGLTYPDDDWVGDEVEDIKAALSFAPGPFWAAGGSFLTGTNVLTPAGRQFRDFVEVGSGGERGAFFDVGWDYWNVGVDPDFFFDLGEGDGTIANRRGIVAQNTDTDYSSEYGFDIDADVVRVEAAKRVRKAQGTKPAPILHGTPSVPVLTMHTIGDLFVPIEMEQIYAAEVAANGREHLLVQRAIRDVGHCTFTEAEWIDGYQDLFDWVDTGTAPAGEDLSDLSDPLVGCAFTRSVPPLPSGAVRAFPCP